MGEPESWRATAEAAWSWVLNQVRWGPDGPWIPRNAAAAAGAKQVPDDDERDSVYEGIGGIGMLLAEIRLSRSWTPREQNLVEAIISRLDEAAAKRREPSLFVGLAGDLTVLRLLAPGRELPVARRLAELATADGWPTTMSGMQGPITDLLLGTAGVVLAGLWAGGEFGDRIARVGGEALARQAERDPRGCFWRMHPSESVLMPNYSHGNAGIAAALALAGDRFGTQEWIDIAVAGAEFVLAVANCDDRGLTVPHYVPNQDDADEVTHTWCHGGAGTSYLFLALHAAGVSEVAEIPPMEWHERALRSLRHSGLPARLHPGFWDNDGRCCGTAGVGEVFLDDAQLRAGQDSVLPSVDFAREMADVLVERAVVDDGGARWQFIEHRANPPLLPPGVGWMQGAAGIAAFLFRTARLSEEGLTAERLSRPDTLPLERAIERSS